MIASPTRTACPGFNLTSRLTPLRLFSSPTTATRCAIGVPPVGSASSPDATVSIPVAVVSSRAAISCVATAGPAGSPRRCQVR